MTRRDEVSGEWRILHNEMCYWNCEIKETMVVRKCKYVWRDKISLQIFDGETSSVLATWKS
jgi:hypothetical protein